MEVKLIGNEATRFQKGNKLAVGKGRPPMSPEKKALAIATRVQLKELMLEFLTYTPEEVAIALEDSSRAVLDIMILRAIQRGHSSGDMITLDWITDHIMGKQAAKVEVKSEVNNSINIKKLSDKELLTLKELAVKSQK